MNTPPSRIKIVGAGMPRTGTMSLKVALETLGYGRCYHMVDLMQNLSQVPTWLAASRGEAVDWDELLAGFQAIVDIPGQRYYQALMRAYPEAKIILSTRDPSRWYDSVKQTIYQAHALNEVSNSWWWLRYPLSAQRKHKVLLGGLIGKILWDDYFNQRFEDKDYVLSVYDNHLKAVQEHVPKDNLLVFDVAEGWEPLCRFLDRPVPSGEAFPHVNDSDQFRRFWQVEEAVATSQAPVTMAQQVTQHSVKSPARIALIFQHKAMTYGELQSGCQQVASALQQRGLSSGERVVLYLPNCPEFIISYLAVQQLGGVMITLNTALKAPEITHILDDSQAGFVITNALLQRLINREHHAHLKQVLLIDDLLNPSESAGVNAATSQLAVSLPEVRTPALSADDPAVILYSSGTTGRPKGAVLSHGNLLSSAQRISAQLDLGPDSRVLLFLPLFHCYALTTMLNPALYRQASIVLLPEFDSSEFLRSIDHYQVTTLFAVPAIYTLLTQSDEPIESSLFRSVKHCLSAGAHLPAEVARRWHEQFGLVIKDGLGFTEGSHVTLNQNPLKKPNSVGLPLPGTEIKVISETGQRCETNTPGEISVRGPTIMLGYWDQQAAAINDGWFCTGDIGYQDTDGYLYIVDRQKDMVNVGGEKVYSTEVEQVLYCHPSIAEAAVYGIPHPVLGEEVRASVVLKAGQSADAAEIIDFCRKQLAHFKLPGTVEFCVDLPKNKTGKILKRVLRERFSTAVESADNTQTNLRQQLSQASSAAQRYSWLVAYLQTDIQQLTGWEAGIEQSVFELGVDSLMSIQLANRLSGHLGLSLSSTVVMEYPRISELAQYLSTCYEQQTLDTPENTAACLPVAWDIHDWFPQSYIQQLYYGWHEAAENKCFMNMNFVVRVRTPIDRKHFQAALQLLLDRHADLRLVYDRHHGVPVQKVKKHQPAFFVAQSIDNQCWEEARPAILAASRRPFDLRHDATMRTYLFSRNPTDHILLIVRHHIINDRTTAALVLDELFTLYQCLQNGTAAPPVTAPSYFEFMQWHEHLLESAAGLAHRDYWEQQLAAPLTRLNLPTDYPRRPKNRHYGAAVNTRLPGPLVAALRQLAMDHEVTLYAVMMAAFKLLLYVHTGQRDILVDTSMINRTEQRFENTLGQLSIIHSIRTQVSTDACFSTLVADVQQTVRDALKHQAYPSQLLIEQLQLPSGYVYNRPGQVLFNLVSAHLTRNTPPTLRKGGLLLEPSRLIPAGSAGTFHEINVQWLEQGEEIIGHVNYETDLYKPATIRRLMSRYERILQQLIKSPALSIADLPVEFDAL